MTKPAAREICRTRIAVESEEPGLLVGDPVAVLPIRLETLLVVAEDHFWEPA
ncbi:hypothetical protein BHE90_011585 [Fusarium euwallaceae]|uniref:Uncharacterized protein n=2 Tax=Fusarium solani species complex TaxID=232080 RepID=A0A430LE79_9HYPO|nr:hypothetical protein CEP51_010067 [Fusarium floridanum]RTE73971.1 hypothetical protein BHE90_011585 [Fusarium euwallaceae]